MSYEPCDGAADSNASPADNTSVTWTPVAGLGPWLATITLNVSSSPTCGDDRVSVLITFRLADSAALSVTLARLLTGFESASVCCVMIAALTSGPGAVTVATIVSVTGGGDLAQRADGPVRRHPCALRRRGRHQREPRGQHIGDDETGRGARASVGTVTVNVTFSPTNGTSATACRRRCPPRRRRSPGRSRRPRRTLLLGTGSGSFCRRTWARFVIESTTSSVEMSVSVANASSSNVPTIHRPVCGR